MPNKIKYGIKNVYVAVATIGADNSATYGIPFAVPGAVSLSLDPQGENTPFYADNIQYWVGVANTGYEGDLEVAMLSDNFHKTILNAQEDSNGVLLEDSDVEAVHFALMFQVEGDVKATRHVLYNCTCTRPSAGGETKEDTVEPQTETTTITAAPVYMSGLDRNIVKAKTTEGTDATAYAEWFESVYIPPSTPVSNPVLTALSIGANTLVPTFDSDTKNYTVSTSTSSEAVTATAEEGYTVTIMANGATIDSGDSVTWDSGSNTVVITVADSGAVNINTYTVVVTYTV